MELFTGMKFIFVTENSKFNAEIIEIQEIYVIVLINGKKIKLEKRGLIERFIESKRVKESKRKKPRQKVTEKNHTESKKDAKSSKHCRDCMEYKNGNCFGASKICDDFRNSPKVSDEERSRWPQNGQVSRKKSDTYIIRDYDFLHFSGY